MWFPDLLFELWSDADPEPTKTAQADTTERDFEVAFPLVDRARLRDGVGVQMPGPRHTTQTDGTGRKAEMWFRPDMSGRLEAIYFKLADRSARLACIYCHDKLCQLLSFWAVIYGSAFSIASVLVVDLKHGVQYRGGPKPLAPDDFILPGGLSFSGERWALLALYREARSSPSPFYRFLCCYKILEAWYKLGATFGEADRIIKEKGLGLTRPKRVVTREMLVMALILDRHPEFEGLRFGRLFELLNPWRVKVAHAVTDAAEFINLDSYGEQLEIVPIANLTDLIARQVLLDELELWRQIAAALAPSNNRMNPPAGGGLAAD